MNFDLNKHTARLLRNEPFFAALSRKIDKRSSTAVPTAGVRVNPETGHFEMLYNPEFFAGLSDDHKQGVLMHEFYHLVFEHVTGRLPEGGMTMIWNQATDLAINSHLLGKLPEGALIPGEGYFETRVRFLFQILLITVNLRKLLSSPSMTILQWSKRWKLKEPSLKS